MAIRFYCSGCGQHIEVDDEHAGRLVQCPFCKATVTATPAAAPAGGGSLSAARGALPSESAAVGPSEAAYRAAQRAQRGAQLSSAGLACGLLTVLLPLVWVYMLGSMTSLQQQLVAATQPPTMMEQDAMTKAALAELLDQHPGAVMGMTVVTIILFVTGIGASIAGLVMSSQRRWQAVLGLVLCGFCGGFCSLTITLAALAQERAAG